jgi:NADH:ubiquinone oxidoreductase subunit
LQNQRPRERPHKKKEEGEEEASNKYYGEGQNKKGRSRHRVAINRLVELLLAGP